MDSLSERAARIQARADLDELAGIVRYQNEREMARVVVEANRREIAAARLAWALEHWS